MVKDTEKSEVSLGLNKRVVKRRGRAKNSANVAPHRLLAWMSTDTFCQHIYSHSHVIPCVQTSADQSLCIWVIFELRLVPE